MDKLNEIKGGKPQEPNAYKEGAHLKIVNEFENWEFKDSMEQTSWIKAGLSSYFGWRFYRRLILLASLLRATIQNCFFCPNHPISTN